MPFAIRIFFNGVPTGTILNFEDEETRDERYTRFQELKAADEVFYGPNNTIDFTQVRMFEKL